MAFVWALKNAVKAASQYIEITEVQSVRKDSEEDGRGTACRKAAR